ncbi:hypothetical protein GCM10023185_37220 [Hymenobacter saemangeumensis]|uniref:Uncharacterized protein n=1 Tax=Hymenobacter saemangeumensis TaxID=1084522 RepID=A0ABP8IQ48_9BACT
MLPNLAAIETRAGRIALGAKVKSTRYPVQGLVTAIVWAGYFYAIQVDNRHSDDAAHYELLSPPTPQGFNFVNPFSQRVTSGTFEVLLPGEGDRIYFADDAHQAVALLAAAIGLKNPQQWVDYLTQRAAAGPVNELRWRGEAVGSIVGQLAYVSTRQERAAPLFAIGQLVTFYNGHAPNSVSGIALYKDRRNYGKTVWHYFNAEAHHGHHPMSEAHTAAAPAQPSPQTATKPASATPLVPAEPTQFSEAMQLILASQAATVHDVAQQMKATPRKAAKLLKEMQELYGPAPTLLHLALFSGAADLIEMITALRKPGAPLKASSG